MAQASLDFLEEQTKANVNEINWRIASSYINEEARKLIPKYSKINSAFPYASVDRDGLSVKTSNSDLKIWLSSTSDNNGSVVFVAYQGTEVIPNSYKEFKGNDIKDYMYSATANAGEAKGWGAWVCTASATLKRDFAIKDRKIVIDYTAPAFKISTYTIADGVTGAGGTVSGGGTWEVGIEDKTVTLTATPASGYRFKHWSDGSESVGTDPTLTVTISQNNISAFETVKTYAAFFEKATYDITVTAGEGGTVTGGGTYEQGATATLKATANSGYKFVKWSDGVATATRTVTVTGEATYTAVFTPICVTYDNIFNFFRWREKGVTSGRGTISNTNDLGFTFTASVDDGYTGYSHMFAVEPGKKYTLEYDCTGGTSNQTFVFFHSADGDYNWTKLADSALKKWSFTVPDGFYLASIRVDVNNKGETINYSNFRIYPADCDYMGNTVPMTDRFDKAGWSIPTPTRDCYIFKGWNTKADGSGKFYTASDAYPTDDLVLYSIWQADPPKFTDAQMLYNGKIVASGNKVPAGQSFILKCKLE